MLIQHLGSNQKQLWEWRREIFTHLGFSLHKVLEICLLLPSKKLNSVGENVIYTSVALPLQHQSFELYRVRFKRIFGHGHSYTEVTITISVPAEAT